MTIFRRLNLDGPNMEIKVIENGENRDRTLTWVVELNQIMDNPKDEQVIWTMTLPNLTPHQVRCLAGQFEQGAILGEDDREKLREDKNFTIKLPGVVRG